MKFAQPSPPTALYHNYKEQDPRPPIDIDASPASKVWKVGINADDQNLDGISQLMHLERGSLLKILRRPVMLSVTLSRGILDEDFDDDVPVAFELMGVLLGQLSLDDAEVEIQYLFSHVQANRACVMKALVESFSRFMNTSDVDVAVNLSNGFVGLQQLFQSASFRLQKPGPNISRFSKKASTRK